MGKGAEGAEADDAGDEDEDAWVECVFSTCSWSYC